VRQVIYKEYKFCVAFFLLGNKPASKIYVPTFRNTVSVSS